MSYLTPDGSSGVREFEGELSSAGGKRLRKRTPAEPWRVGRLTEECSRQ